MIGNLEMAIEDLPRDVKAITLLAAAIQGGRKTAEVSNQLLTFLGQTSALHVPLDLSESCRQILTFFQAGDSHSLILKVNLPFLGPTNSANANQIQQVLTNLVTNAREAVGEMQGTVTLTVKTVPLTDISEVHRHPIDWLSQNEKYACLEVTGTGFGIANDAIDKVFNPFFATQFTGRGLGLPVILGIVRAHDGVITLATEKQGTSFQVFLPLSAEEIPRQPGKTEQPFAREGIATVLLIEDDEMIRDMATTMIMRLGYKVLSAKDGIEVMEMFAQHQNEPEESERLLCSGPWMPCCR